MSEDEREAIRLAGDFRSRIQRWLDQREIQGPLIALPCVGIDGKPNVEARTGGRIARTLAMGLGERSHPPPPSTWRT
ncbi:hypothetical protein [Actinomadura sp. WMMB 499]|uniref:hypothetical protein n=1 Tax=Actinomadura sp. WMMB 499 TaxID=1219491 RepID=UPI0012476A3C|nr:hypothetical protein [Actinomadura sp. WMMB 499]QFG22879.1 hypothetical protein F7P10_18920 [Actinomadura sp. WMMB 499]